MPKETCAVLEATRNWPFMYDLLHEHAQQVDLVHAKTVRTIANAAVKTDQIEGCNTGKVHLALASSPKAKLGITATQFSIGGRSANSSSSRRMMLTCGKA